MEMDFLGNKLNLPIRGKKKECYVAMVIYGSEDSAECAILREWRDNTLCNYYGGRLFISYYYKKDKYLVEIFLKNSISYSAY